MSKRNEAPTMDDSDAGAARSQLAQRHYDANGDGELTTAIVFAVAEAADVAPADLRAPPLYECIDAPALEATFFGPDATGGSRRGIGTVEFRYADYLVSVGSDGWIRVFEPAGSETRE
jgi:hypothetical protein